MRRPNSSGSNKELATLRMVTLPLGTPSMKLAQGLPPVPVEVPVEFGLGGGEGIDAAECAV